MNMKKGLTLGLAVVMSATLLAGCGGSSEKKAEPQKAAVEITGTVKASGSTALLPLLKAGQEEFQKKNPKATVNIAGGGSFTGQNQVATGAVDIGNSDVALDAKLNDKGLVEHKLVGIPFVFIANKDVDVDNLTTEQYVGIMTGKISNWKEVGGKDLKITLVHRAPSSGSRATIQELVLKTNKFTDNAVIQDSNGAVRAAIASTTGAFGYVDAAYADATVKTLAVDGVKYSLTEVASGKYKILTFGRMFTKGAPTGAAKAFIDFVTSKEFQETYAEKSGFVPLTKMPK
ncbi:MAG TPA: phosphate ABC transporter substrate-binding protein [Negativicutes bacterium]|nr:phosphate ABC transporter substrate-binding protein [Negativicutes bacterium]